MLQFPLQDLLNEEDSYQWLLKHLHPNGLHCPNGHPLPEGQAPHDRQREPLVKYRCRSCGAVYNIFSGTIWRKTHLDCRIVVLLLRGFTKGATSQMLADELGLSYKTVLKWRHRVQKQAIVESERITQPDKEVEADEVFVNAGEKGEEHPDADDPPRQRSNPRRGRGTYEQDRPVVAGTVGRETGQLQATVVSDTKNETLTPLYAEQIDEDTIIYSDEAHHFKPLEAESEEHHTVAHGKGEYAKDPDDDGHHEIHSNTIEGIWVGFRNYIRRFRGVHKRYLNQYVAMFELAFNLDSISSNLVRQLCLPQFTLDYT